MTVDELFKLSNLKEYKQIKWGTKFYDEKSGVYIVSLSDNPLMNSNLQVSPLINNVALSKWIRNAPQMSVDNQVATRDLLEERLTKFWLAHENILYIGKAGLRVNRKGISNRIMEYFRTEIGKSTPHAGGQWLKVLDNIDDLYVYYAYTDVPCEIEKEMLSNFMRNVREQDLACLFDSDLPLPFANLEYPHGKRKKHGLKKQRK